MAKAAHPSRTKVVSSKKTSLAGTKKRISVADAAPYGLVNFCFQKIDYQIDLGKSKVYKRFIEVEKSKQNSIITAYRTVATRPTA